jgi:hypothetical protein
MTQGIRQVKVPSNFIGASTDNKPTPSPALAIPEGSTLHLEDTDQDFVFHLGGWVKVEDYARYQRDRIIALLEASLAEQKATRELIELALSD